MESNIYSKKSSFLVKTILLFLVFSLLGTACSARPNASPTTTTTPTKGATQPATQAIETPTLEELPTEPVIEGSLPTDEALPTDESGLDAFPTDDPEMLTAQVDLGTPEFGTIEPMDTPEPQGNQPTEDLSGLQTTAEPGTDVTKEPTFNPTPANIPVGQPGNPIILGVVMGGSEGDPTTMLDSSDQLAAQLSDLTGYTIQVQSVNTTVELLNGMQVGAIHMAWLQPFTYILASRRGYAKVGLVSNHFGLYAYGAQFLANSKSGFTSFYNSNTGKTTGDASEALDQFADKRPCYVDPLSASGYIAAAGYLEDLKIKTGAPVFLQSHTAVVRALYLQGICDFGVTFALYGDPRTASAIQQDLPDVMQKVVVVWQTGQIIPNLNLSFNTSVPDDVAKKISSALTDFVLGEDGRALVSSAAGYDIQDLKQVDDKFYDELRKLVTASRVNLKTLIGK